MSYEQTTPPSVNAISLQDAKDHLRIDGTDEDALILAYIRAASDYAEKATNLQFLTSTWKLRLNEFPAGSDPIIFQKNPVQSISSISYVDIDGNSQTWASSNYEVDVTSRPGRIRPVNTESYPSTKDQYNAVTITFDAGYGDDNSDVPDEIRSALRIMVSYLFENRDMVHSMNGESVVVQWPVTIDTLLALEALPEML